MIQQELSDIGMIIKSIICRMVDHPTAVRIGEVTGLRTVMLEVRVAPSDLAKVIGRNGRNTSAIRDLLASYGGKDQRRYRLTVCEA